MYIKYINQVMFGIHKEGKKNIFYRDYNGNIMELQPICVLDFYVHESV